MTDLKLFKKFMQTEADTSWIGLGRIRSPEQATPYFCDPIGFREFAGLEVDGIRYGFIDGFGETVFVVNPLPPEDEYVCPIARNFEDFLRLVLACKNANSFDQMIWMDREQYERLQEQTVRDLPEESAQALNTIQEEFGLEPMPNPFDYVKRLQKEFDPSVLQFSDEYYDTLGLELPER